MPYLIMNISVGMRYLKKVIRQNDVIFDHLSDTLYFTNYKLINFLKIVMYNMSPICLLAKLDKTVKFIFDNLFLNNNMDLHLYYKTRKKRANQYYTS